MDDGVPNRYFQPYEYKSSRVMSHVDSLLRNKATRECKPGIPEIAGRNIQLGALDYRQADGIS